MTPEMQAALDKLTADQATISTALATIAASVAKLGEPISAANMLPKVEPHAATLEAAADKMESAGIGGDPNNGHAMVLRRMAGDMRAEAVKGHMPSRWSLYAGASKETVATVDVAGEVAKAIAPIAASLAAMSTQIADVKASAAAQVKAPERKTLPSNITQLLAKAGIKAPEVDGEKIQIGALDAAIKDMPLAQRLEVKASLARANLID